MKKSILTIVILFFVSYLWAGIDTILSFKTYFTFNNIPQADLVYDGKRYIWNNVEDKDFWNNLDNDWWMKRQDYWMNAYDKTSFFDSGFEAHLGSFLLVTRMDIMQDALLNLQNPSCLVTNLPLI